MKKYLNNKGFSLVELLAAVTILGILMLVAVVGYSKYIDKAKKDSIDIFNKSSLNAAEEYFMDNPTENVVSISVLVDNDYLEAPSDKITNNKTYKGQVKRGDAEYTLYMCFDGNYYKYKSGTIEKIFEYSDCSS